MVLLARLSHALLRHASPAFQTLYLRFDLQCWTMFARCARIDPAGATTHALLRHASPAFQTLHIRFDLQTWTLCARCLPFEFVSFFSHHFAFFFWLSQCTLRVCACPSPIRDARGLVLPARLYSCSLRHAKCEPDIPGNTPKHTTILPLHTLPTHFLD